MYGFKIQIVHWPPTYFIREFSMPNSVVWTSYNWALIPGSKLLLYSSPIRKDPTESVKDPGLMDKADDRAAGFVCTGLNQKFKKIKFRIAEHISRIDREFSSNKKMEFIKNFYQTRKMSKIVFLKNFDLWQFFTRQFIRGIFFRKKNVPKTVSLTTA